MHSELWLSWFGVQSLKIYGSRLFQLYLLLSYVRFLFCWVCNDFYNRVCIMLSYFDNDTLFLSRQLDCFTSVLYVSVARWISIANAWAISACIFCLYSLCTDYAHKWTFSIYFEIRKYQTFFVLSIVISWFYPYTLILYFILN